MKNFTKFFIAIVAVVLFASAQMNVKAQAFENGNMVGNAGIGIGWWGYGIGSASSLPFINISLEKGIKDFDFGVLSVGGTIGYKHTSWGSSFNYDWSWTDFVVGANGALHVDLFKVENLDTYGGVCVGLRFQSHKYNDILDERYTSSEVHPVFGTYVGARYYFSDKFAVFAEGGWRPSILNLGVSLKLK